MFERNRISYIIVVLFVNQYWYDITTSQCQGVDKCITDFAEQDCGAGQSLVPHSDRVFGCCPTCQPGTGIVEGVCRPPSNCLPDGQYAPVQCKGDHFTGRCFCSDKNGNRVFGQMWRTNAEGMTCACSRRRAELEASGRNDVSLHCTPTGDYEPLQCDSGLCWCAEPSTGQPTVSPVPEDDMRRLPCYSSAQLGEQYLRRCESTVYALAVIQREQSEHGTHFLGNPVTFCDYDGSYGAFQIQHDIAYCTDRDGSILGSWQVVAAERAGMNCNCAQDTAIHFPAQGMTVSHRCLANGNYNPIQTIGDQTYCVDSDGYPTTASPEQACLL